MLQEFKDFINKGNVVDLAVAVVMALAFVPVIRAIVDDVVLAFVAGIFGEPNFNEFLSFGIRDAVVRPGRVITEGLLFLAVAAAVFIVVRAYNRMRKADDAPAGPTEIELLTQIRDQLARR